MTDYTAQPGPQTLTGTNGNDNFIFNFDQVDSAGAASPEHDIDAGDVVDGGAGTDALWAGQTMDMGYSENFDFRPVTFISIEELDFNWMAMQMPGKLTFNSSQFGSGLSNNLVVKGAWGDNDITVYLDTANFDASGWTFPTPATTTVDGSPAGTSFYGWGPYVYTGNGAFKNLQVGVFLGDTIHLIGSTADNVITGTIVADIITGGEGADTLTGGAGNDSIDGGGGNDTVVFSGNRADYTVTETSGTFTVVDNRVGSPNGADTVTTVESFQFADMTLAAANVVAGTPPDTTPPAAPTIAAWTDTTAPVLMNGVNPLWRISGTAEAGSTVKLYSVTLNADGTIATSTQIATYTQATATTVVAGVDYVVADANGNWSFQTNLNEHGDRRIVATATDATGNVSGDSLVYIQGGHHATTFSFADPSALSHISVIAAYHDWTSPATGDTLQFTTATTVVDSDFAKITDMQNLKLTGASAVTLGATALAAGVGGEYEAIEGDPASTGHGKVIVGDGDTSLTDTNAGSTLRVETAALNGHRLTLAGAANFIVSDFVIDNSTGEAKSDPANAAVIDASAATGTNTFNGGDGDDTFELGSGANTIDGGAGSDAADYSAIANNISVRLQGTVAVADAAGHGLPGSYVTGGASTVTITGGTNDALYRVENVTGGSGNDTLMGDGAVNILRGGLGNDNLVANRQVYINAGDVFDGGEGVDTLWAGKGMTDIDYGAADTVSRLDFSAATLQSIEVFAFNYMPMPMPGTATFSSAQFGAGLLATNLVVYGAWGDNDITVDLTTGDSSFDASGWTFAGAGSTSGTSSYAWGHYVLTADKGMGKAGQEVGGSDTIHLVGSEGNNGITGTNVDDIITGGAGNDVINGGAGFDTAVYSGNRSNYTIARSGTSYTITDKRAGSPDGTDTLTNIEWLKFADGATRPGSVKSDFDANGYSDLLLENSAGAVVLAQSAGGAHLAYSEIAALGSEWTFRGNGDFLGDSGADFLIENADGALVLADVDSGHATYTQIGALGPEWRFRGTGDFSGGGHDQFLIENDAGAIVVGDAQGGQAQYSQIAALGSEWTIVGVGDFFGDGADDFLIERTDGVLVIGDVDNGSTAFTDVGALGSEWKFVGTGDYLGLGHDQFIIENQNGIVVLGDAQTGHVQYTELGAIGSEWSFVGTGDYAGTGADSFMLQNQAGVLVNGVVSAGHVSYAEAGAIGSEWSFRS